MKLLKLSRPKLGFVLALAEVIYVAIIGVFMTNGDALAGSLPVLLAPVLFLLVFVVSAAISGLLIFGYPAYLAIEKRWGEACGLVGWTIGWLIAFAIFVVASASVLF